MTDDEDDAERQQVEWVFGVRREAREGAMI
jgi:hypothetical protein